MTPGLRRDKTRPAHPLTGHTGTKLALQRPFIGTSGTKLALHTIKRQFWALFRLRGEYSHARSLTKQSRAKIVTHRARQHKRSKETSPLREVLRAVVKHFSPTRVHKSHFWPFSTEQGRCFFHCGCMPGTGAVRWGDISFRTSPRRPIEPPILTRRTRDQQTGGTGVMGTEGHGRGAGGRQHGQNKHTRPKPHPIGGHRVACGARPRCRRAAAWPGQTTSQRTEQHQRPGSTGVEGAGGTGGHGRGAGGRRHGQNKHTRPKPHPIGGRRGACGARPRCRWAAAGPGRASSRRAQPHTATRRRRCGGRRRDRRVRPRCRWAAAGRGRASRSTTPSRQARVWRSRGRAAAHRHTQRPGPSRQATRRPEHPWVHKQRRRSGGSASGTATTGGRKAYSPRNALIAGISRTACTRPAR